MRAIIIRLWKVKWVAILLWLTAAVSIFYWANYEREEYQAEAVVNIGYSLEDGEVSYFDGSHDLESLLVKKYSHMPGASCTGYVEAVTVRRLRVICYGHQQQTTENAINEIVNYVIEKNKEDYSYLKAIADANDAREAAIQKLIGNVIKGIDGSEIGSNQRDPADNLLYWLAEKELLNYKYRQHLKALHHNGLMKTQLSKEGVVMTHRTLGGKKIFIVSIIIFLFGLFGAMVVYFVGRDVSTNKD